MLSFTIFQHMNHVLCILTKTDSQFVIIASNWVGETREVKETLISKKRNNRIHLGWCNKLYGSVLWFYIVMATNLRLFVIIYHKFTIFFHNTQHSQPPPHTLQNKVSSPSTRPFSFAFQICSVNYHLSLPHITSIYPQEWLDSLSN